MRLDGVFCLCGLKLWCEVIKSCVFTEGVVGGFVKSSVWT